MGAELPAESNVGYHWYQWSDEWIEPSDFEFDLLPDEPDDPGFPGVPTRPRPHAPAGSAALVLA